MLDSISFCFCCSESRRLLPLTVSEIRRHCCSDSSRLSCCSGVLSGTKAPRQPWHDLHCKVEGLAAYDVLINFEQRWKRATRFREFSLKKKITHWHDDALIKINRISWILSPAGFGTDTEITVIPEENPSVRVSDDKDPETWHVQVFTSIDSGSLKGFSKSSGVCAKNLDCSKNLVIDKSIQTAYIQAIRSAHHFIYIENQYFLGSSYGWPSYKNAGRRY